MENKEVDKERSFSIELKSKTNLNNLTLTNGSNEKATIEGTIGKLERAQFIENTVLEIVGQKGNLMVEVSGNEINKTSAKEVKKQ